MHETVRRLLYRDVLAAVGFVTLAFLALFFFIDFVEELERLRRGAPAWHAALLATLELPTHLYDVLPITVLIGTVVSLARLAQTSEFTILRTGGLGPGRRWVCCRCSRPALRCSPSQWASGWCRWPTNNRKPPRRAGPVACCSVPAAPG